MALTNQTEFHQWLNNIVDTLNFNIQKIGDALAITNQLSFFDPPPISNNDDIMHLIKEEMDRSE